jgi:RNA polymerase sigma factor (sigma-70 family)
MPTDAEMLQRYARERDERAFAELVQRHLGLVYGAALRRTGGRTHLAEEIAQKVFTDLARKAAVLSHHPTLTGWLYRSTRYAAIDAARAELRGKKLAQSLAAMPDTNLPPETQVEWERLRPVLDEAMDRLKETDREAMLLRYFEGLGFAEVGARLNVSENAARMRIERALEKLRHHLGKRGVTSTTAALGLLLANQAFATAPAGLAVTVTSSALAAVPAAGGVISFLFMSKIATPAISVVFAAGATVLVWTSFMPAGVSAEELVALRAENARLTQATAADAPAEDVAAVANEYALQATSIAQAMAARRTAQTAGGNRGAAEQAAPGVSGVTPRGHRNHGTATAHDAALTFAWAGDICDPEILGQLLYFDSAAREKALAVLATMPESIRTQYPTPEAFYGLLLAASCMEAPPPGADILEKARIVELSPGRVSHQPPGSTRDDWQYQQTPAGWKYVLPLAGVEGLPSILNSQTLANLSKH